MGAFLGPRRLHVSSISDLSKATLFHGDLSGRTEGARPGGLMPLMARVERTRGFGDFYQHMLVAEGAGEIAIDAKMQPWDIAAVKIIVEEAGGVSTSFRGENTIAGGNLLSTNRELHTAVTAILSV
jgi:histidinol-phosphatase